MVINLVDEITDPVIIIDTDVFSYWLKDDPRGNVFKPFIAGRTGALAFATVGELYYWAYKNNWGVERINKLNQKISGYLVLPYDERICQEYARARVQQEIKGATISYTDYWIAACALVNKCPILTNNFKHFSRIQRIKLLGPYSS